MQKEATPRFRGGTCVFPRHLRTLLERIPDHPLTVVEAPSGFGKTTAVREFLGEPVRVNSRRNWYTCFGERASKAWEGFCRLFGNVDMEAARKLKKLFPPTVEILPDIAAILSQCRCDVETYLVIDNYQLFETDIPCGLIGAFSAHGNENLHIVFITQPLPSFGGDFRHSGHIHRLDTRDFFFDRESTARLCRLSGANVSESDVDYIQSVSEGWVSAILLQASNFRETGSFARVPDMEGLLETAVWDRMSGENRTFLMGVSLLDAFTPRQGALAGGWITLPEDVTRMLRSSFFISYIADKGAYSIHSILREYLRKQFENQPPALADLLVRRAGDACRDASDYFEAAKFYMKLRDCDAILSLPFSGTYLNEQKEKEIISFLERLVSDCSEETLRRYPFTLLLFAFHFLKSGMRDRFSRMVNLLRSIIASPGNLSEDDLSRLKGETALLLSFTEFNDIAKMSAYHREALAHLSSAGGGASPRTVIFGLTPWTFGIPSVLSLYWSRTGGLDESLDLMDECMPLYVKLAGGHGTGADVMMRAEAHLCRGEEKEAETLSHKALYIARGAGQTSLCLCAELVLGRLAILRGDGAAYGAVRENISGYRKESSERSIARMVELCLAVLDLSVGKTEKIPVWLRKAESLRKVLYIQGHPYGLMFYARLLFLEKRYPELYGMAEPAMEMASGMKYELPRLWMLLHLAASKNDEGQSVQALEYLGRALLTALPDRMHLPFAEFGISMVPLLQAVKKDFGGEALEPVMNLCRRGAAGLSSVLARIEPKLSLLTPREREIALLARDRLTAAEIGSRLFISENTVKSALKLIYSKLDVHSRSELVKKDF